MNVLESIMTGLQEAVEHEEGRIQAKAEKLTDESQPTPKDSRTDSASDQ